MARAGAIGAITVATRLAGRGTDIKLDDVSPQRGGLLVIDAQANGSRRIDRQLHGRCARGGEPGQVLCLQSLQTDLFAQGLPRALRAALALWARLDLRGTRAAPALPQFLALPLLRLLQHRVQRQERQQRQALKQQDELINRQLGFGGRFE